MGAFPVRLVGSAGRRDPGARSPGPGGQFSAAAVGRVRPGGIHRRPGRLPVAGHRGRRGRAAGGRASDRRPDLGAVRQREAARRAWARAAHADAIDGANRPADGSPPDDAGWMAEEIPFNTAQRTWERADLIVCGTPEIPFDPVTEIVVAGPRWRQ